MGDIRNIRKEKDMGHKVNQKFHGLPYNRLYIMLGYKLKLYGIQLIKQEESYTSQCSPLSPEVSKRYAEATKRKDKGNRQYVKNVFGTNWLPYVTSYYGYRVHPTSGEKNYHTGVDIGMPEGTEIIHVGLPPRCICPRIVARVSTPVASSIRFAMLCE